MDNEQNNSNNQNQENQGLNNCNHHEHPQGAHPYTEHHHRCGIHVYREPGMCKEKYCAQKLICKAFKILVALGIAFMIFISGVVVGAHIGFMRGGDRSFKTQHIPSPSSPSGQFRIQVAPEHQTQREYYFKFDN